MELTPATTEAPLQPAVAALKLGSEHAYYVVTVKMSRHVVWLFALVTATRGSQSGFIPLTGGKPDPRQIATTLFFQSKVDVIIS